jgi:chaperonin GroEL
MPIEYNNAVQEMMLSGVNQLADCIRLTLGPCGRYVVIEKTAAKPVITNDGATIAKEIELEDSFENMGAQVIKEVAAKTNELAGDGTTTATVLAQQIVAEGLRQLASGANPVEMKKGMQGATDVAVAAIKKLAHAVAGQDEVAKVATISAQDPGIGKLVAEALEAVGRDGSVKLDEANTSETKLEIALGMVFDRGFLLPTMAADVERQVSDLKDPYILVTDQSIANAEDIVPLLDEVAKRKRPLLIIAEGLEGAALATVMENNQRKLIDAVAIQPPAYGDGRRALMDDIALYTGGTFFSKELGSDIANAAVDQLGQAASVHIERKKTIIVKGSSKDEDVALRVGSLRAMIEQSDYDFKKEQLKERLARLASGIAVISVGAATEVEMKEKKLRFEDALNAAKAAIEEGVVPGGGTAFLNIIPAVQAYAETLDNDRKAGALIIVRALEAPARQIAANSGKDGAAVVARTRQASTGIGFDAATGEHVGLLERGIIDSAKVTRLALASAVSASSVLLTTQAGYTKAKDTPKSAAEKPR